MTLGTGYRQLVHLYALREDGSGLKVGDNIELEFAEAICEAVEKLGLTPIVDPPAFGLIQNLVAWGPGGSGLGDVRKTAPWREYLAVRKTVTRTRDAFDQLYEKNADPDGDSFFDRWRPRGD